MQVTCSNCGARYAVDPLAIGPLGRTVQCARCHHRWFERADGVRPPPDLVIRPPTPGAALPAVIQPKPSLPWGRVVATFVIVVALLAALVFAFRHEIALIMSDTVASVRSTVRQAVMPSPPMPKPTQEARPTAVPLPPPTPQLALLEIDLGNSKIELVEGRYVVRGEIVNNGQAAGSTRTLRLTFKKNDDVLGERDYALVRGPIAPGERLAFSQALDEPPTGTTDIVPAVE